MYHPQRVPFLRKTPPLFYHYHSILEHQKHRLCQHLSYLLSIHLDLPECAIYIHFRRYPESCSCRFKASFFTISFIGAVPHYHTNFNLWKFEFSPENSKDNTPRFYHCTVPHIIQQDGHPFPSYFLLLNTGNDVINSRPWYLSLPLKLKTKLI